MEISIVILLSSIVIILLVLAIKFKKEHPFLHIIYLFSMFFIIILSLNITREIIATEGFDINLAPIFFILTIIIAVIFLFYLIVFIKNLIDGIKERDKELGLEV